MHATSSWLDLSVSVADVGGTCSLMFIGFVRRRLNPIMSYPSCLDDLRQIGGLSDERGVDESHCFKLSTAIQHHYVL